MRNLVLFTSMILSFWGCSNDKDFGGLENIGWDEKPLQITTRILTTKSTNFIQEFKEGSMLGLQITSGTVDDLYNGISTYKNVSVKAYRVNGKIRWQQSPEVILDSNEATIYAYYPYQEDINFNARQIPVKLAPNALETDDYMYGTHAIGQKAVNSTSPLVLLSMNHALSLISFQLNLSKGTDGKKYLDYAEKILKSLSSDAYLAKVGENQGFILMHSTGSLPNGSEIDTPLNYADYYYMEALKRFMDLKGISYKNL